MNGKRTGQLPAIAFACLAALGLLAVSAVPAVHAQSATCYPNLPYNQYYNTCGFGSKSTTICDTFGVKSSWPYWLKVIVATIEAIIAGILAYVGQC